MAVSVTFDPFDRDEHSRVRILLDCISFPVRGSGFAVSPPEAVPVADLPAVSLPDAPTPATPAPAVAPDATLTEEYMREQFRLVAMKPGLREAAFAVLSKYGDGKRTLDAVANTHFPAMLAEWQALGA